MRYRRSVAHPDRGGGRRINGRVFRSAFRRPTGLTAPRAVGESGRALWKRACPPPAFGIAGNAARQSLKGRTAVRACLPPGLLRDAALRRSGAFSAAVSAPQYSVLHAFLLSVCRCGLLRTAVDGRGLYKNSGLRFTASAERMCCVMRVFCAPAAPRRSARRP